METTKRIAHPIYQILAALILQRANCAARGNEEYLRKSTDRILDIVKNHMPSGSGVDNGTRIDLEKSTAEKLVFQSDFHHMNENGYYDGWTEHTVTVRASLFNGFTITVSGRNRNEIKDHLADMFYSCLRETVSDD